MPFSDEVNVSGLIVELTLSILTMFLMGLYFYRKGWRFVLYTFLLMDTFNIIFILFDFFGQDFIFSNYTTYMLLANLSYLFVGPLFCVGILITEAKQYEWLKIFAYANLMITALDFVLTRFTSVQYDSMYVNYIIMLTNVFLVLHFLLPDLLDDEGYTVEER